MSVSAYNNNTTMDITQMYIVYHASYIHCQLLHCSTAITIIRIAYSTQKKQIFKEI
jgi:hypothetical protein